MVRVGKVDQFSVGSVDGNAVGLTSTLDREQFVFQFVLI